MNSFQGIFALTCGLLLLLLERVESARFQHSNGNTATTTTTTTHGPTTTTTTTTHVPAKCGPRGAVPTAPTTPLQYNGVTWPAYCFEGDEDEHLFILGDWGGLDYNGKVTPAPNAHSPRYIRRGIDDQAQQLVAQQMVKYAAIKKPRLVLTGGDNFYWGGIKQWCGMDTTEAIKQFDTNPNYGPTLQIKHVFEDMYGGYLSDVPFLLCFGNHDYGGFSFYQGWDQQIAYTWSNASTRWILPGQYWHQHIDYPTKNTSVDVYMVDTNYQDTCSPYDDQGHNICAASHNKGHSCPYGPKDAWDCTKWFKKLWDAEIAWLSTVLCESNADWKIIVTHFPPEDNTHHPVCYQWRKLREQCGIDFYVGSHRHDQELHTHSSPGFPYIVAGGGGGVTSERQPGNNNQYGFFDMKVEKTVLTVTSYNQWGNDQGGMQIFKSSPTSYSYAKCTGGCLTW